MMMEEQDAIDVTKMQIASGQATVIGRRQTKQSNKRIATIREPIVPVKYIMCPI